MVSLLFVRLLLVTFFGGTAMLSFARDKNSCPAPVPEEVERPWLPSPLLVDYDWISRKQWCEKVQAHIMDPTRSTAKLIFIGDSITQGWTDIARDVWDQAFGAYHPLRLGIGGDKTQQVLWRIQEGELQDLDPKALVLLIGTNNLGWGNSVSDTVAGVEAVVSSIQVRLPKTTILLLGVLPAGEKFDDPRRQPIQAVNAALAEKFSHPEANVQFLNLDAAFLQEDGSLSKAAFADFLHPTYHGYEIFARQLAGPLAKIFKSQE